MPRDATKELLSQFGTQQVKLLGRHGLVYHQNISLIISLCPRHPADGLRSVSGEAYVYLRSVGHTHVEYFRIHSRANNESVLFVD